MAPLLLASCSDYAVSVESEDQVTGVWASYGSEATVDFKADGTFTAKDLDTSDLGTTWCPGIADPQHGTWSLFGTYAEVTFEGVDCDDTMFAFHGSPEHFIACFTDDLTATCTEEFDREEHVPGSGDPGRKPTP
ncbi:hypothetical protein ACIGO8_01820 [Streptomyces sp. NPDC053493]|uniref:hypothetical protein n=1 Tax=Streptomyces sp. NPDC053493 TaxID=3365705 RepID=UPI0037D83614